MNSAPSYLKQVGGMIFCMLFLMTTAHAASFDCGKAKSEVEKIICRNSELSRLDESLNKAYLKALKQTDIKEQTIKSQRQWLKNKRNVCQNAECIRKAYQARIKELGLPTYGVVTYRPQIQSTSPPRVTADISKPQMIESPVEVKQIKAEQQHGSRNGAEAEPKAVETPKTKYSPVNQQLLRAADKGSMEKVKTLLAKGGDVNAKDNGGTTVLMAAVRSGNLDLLKFLIAKGAGVNAKDQKGQTALIAAAMRGQPEVVKSLIDEGAAVGSADSKGKTALMYAAYWGYIEIEKLLVDKGADVNARDRDGDTALMAAAWAGKDDVVGFLIANGADVNAKTHKGRTVLMQAVMPYGNCSVNLDVIKLLIDKGANVNARDESGETALMVTARHQALENAKLLIDKGADVNAKTDYGVTALKLAQKTGSKEMVELLKTHGAKE